MSAPRYEAFLLSGKDASKDPCNSLFGTVKAEDATQLGPSKAEAVGNTLMANVTALGHPLLTTLMGSLKDAQDKLVHADKDRDAASDKALAHEAERRKLLKTAPRKQATGIFESSQAPLKDTHRTAGSTPPRPLVG